MLLVILNIVCSCFRLQNLSKRHKPSLLGIVTGVFLDLLQSVSLSKIEEWSAGRWFKKGKDWDATRILQPSSLMLHFFTFAFGYAGIRARRSLKDWAVPRIKILWYPG